jgi:transposase-like protein
LLEKRHWTPKLKATVVEFERTDPILQRQQRLTKAQVIEMAARYEKGATVYELAPDFGCNRTTVAARLKKAGIVMRLQPSSKEVVHEMVSLYQSRL